MRDKTLREHLVAMLTEPTAHPTLDQVLEAFPSEHRGTIVDGHSHSAWQLLEHLRICQWDILQFSLTSDHISPSFPDGYWPSESGPPSDDAWDYTLARYNRDLWQMLTMLSDDSNDLYAPIPHGNGQTLLREALVLAKHNSYHIAQLSLLKTILTRQA